MDKYSNLKLFFILLGLLVLWFLFYLFTHDRNNATQNQFQKVENQEFRFEMVGQTVQILNFSEEDTPLNTVNEN